MKISNIFLYIVLYFSLTINVSYSSTFDEWKKNFKILALSKGISEGTFDSVMNNAKFLPKVIEYDRYQPEFYEDTKTYISKRTSKKKVLSGLNYYKNNKEIINNVDLNFGIEKELLLALMGIETNFGNYLGKMDIISSLSTLSFDKRRSGFFTNELLTILELIDKQIVDPSILYGSWAGAFGNFQFMPSTIEKYAIDYDNNSKIELKNSLEDSLASAANYMSKIGWNMNEPCFYRVDLKKDVNKKYINTSARKIKNRLKVSKWKKKGVFILDEEKSKIDLKAALVMPDGKPDTPAYLVFSNYEKILKWNRSLRFAVTVCTLSNMIKL